MKKQLQINSQHQQTIMEFEIIGSPNDNLRIQPYIWNFFSQIPDIPKGEPSKFVQIQKVLSTANW